MTGRALFTIVLLVKFVSGVGSHSVATGSALSRLSWMAGSWASDSAGVHVEEHWTGPSGGMMLGMHRDLKNGRAVSFEFLRIEGDSTGIRYLAQPRGRPAFPFPMKSIGDGSVMFENKDHDYPQRILYWLDKDGALHARTEGVIKGKLESEEWRWTRTHLGE
jgi:hypothetical protein